MRLISFQANGEVVEHLGQRVAFYGLEVSGNIVEYFTSIQAVRYAAESFEIMQEETAAEFKRVA